MLAIAVNSVCEHGAERDDDSAPALIASSGLLQ
jgi:hypothetical protein